MSCALGRIMDWAILEKLGAVAAVAGIALGIFLILFREFIRRTIFPMRPAESAHRLLRLFPVLAFGIAFAGIAAWLVSLAIGSAAVDCTPKVTNQNGIILVQLNWNCGKTRAERKRVAQTNLSALIDVLNTLTRNNERVVLPALRKYLEDPNATTWKTLSSQVEMFGNVVKNAITAIVQYDAGLEQGMQQERLDALRKVLQERQNVFSGIGLVREEPVPAEEMDRWELYFADAILALTRELEILKRLLEQSA
jgi:hypothetical protein